MYCWEVWLVFHKFKVRIILAKLCSTRYSWKYKLRLEKKRCFVVFFFLLFSLLVRNISHWKMEGTCHLHLTGFWIIYRCIVHFLINLSNVIKSTWNECFSTLQREMEWKMFVDFYSGCASCNICTDKIIAPPFATISYLVEISVCWGHNASEVCFSFSVEDILTLSFSCFLLHYNWR